MSKTNKKHVEIIKKVFGANNGTQLQMLRQKIEVIEFIKYAEENSIVINEEQQKHINEVNELYNQYDSKIHNYLGTTSLKDM